MGPHVEKSGQMAKQHTSHDPPSSNGTEPGGCSAPVDFGFSKAVSGKLSAPIYRSAFRKQVTGSPSFSSASPEQLDELCEGDMKIKFGLHCSRKFTPPRAVWFCSGALSVREEEEWKRERRRGECVVEEPSQLLRAAHAVGNRMSVSTLSPASSTL
ncbi:unnamed protein product [Leuciscus chuanchicus]